MTALPAWATDPASLLVTEDAFDALPEELRRALEVIAGHVVFCRSESNQHSIVARRLATHFEAARPPEPCTRVVTDVEMHYRERRAGTEFSFRRPDVAVYRCYDETWAFTLIPLIDSICWTASTWPAPPANSICAPTPAT
ncbi:hypothetical protein [Nocardia sp. NPDC051570]|uniref:hypothetical protein n=1 Tax=Nocardia sp. NPDC051570 TaxID=3364324 RepID=UPI00379E9B5F